MVTIYTVQVLVRVEMMLRWIVICKCEKDELLPY
jgi:hypothetical protein